MTVQDRIQTDLREAMKAGDKDRVSALRMVLAAIKNRAVEEGRGAGGDLDDQIVHELLQTEVKRRREAADAFRGAGREEQAAREEAEAELYATYLPEPLSDEELRGLVDQAIEEVGAEGPDDMGQVMGTLMPRVGARADGSRVAEVVRAHLTG